MPGQYSLKLYVCGDSLHSRRAIQNLRAICEKYLPGQSHIEIVDVQARPAEAEAERILATPLLVRTAPLPIRRIIGDLSDTTQVLTSLELSEASRTLGEIQ